MKQVDFSIGKRKSLSQHYCEFMEMLEEIAGIFIDLQKAFDNIDDLEKLRMDVKRECACATF